MAAHGFLSASEDDTEEGPYPLPTYVPFVAFAIAGTVACLSGRSRTRIDNFFLGGLLAGFAAYRDPRPTVVQTLVVASVEGAIAGVADRVVPMIKEALLPDEAAAAPASAITA